MAGPRRRGGRGCPPPLPRLDVVTTYPNLEDEVRPRPSPLAITLTPRLRNMLDQSPRI